MSTERPLSFEDDEEDSWIPLKSSGSKNDKKDNYSPLPSTVSGTRTPATEAPRRSSSAQQPPKLQVIQRKLETRIILKRNLVDHPIAFFWKRYIVNLTREVFHLQLSKRLGICLVISGIFLKGFLLSTWYFWYPKLAYTSIILILSVVYFDPFNIRPQVENILSILLKPENAADALEQFDVMQLRRFTFVLLLIPTVLKIRSIWFLSQLHAESGWTLYNVVLGFSILSRMMHQLQVKFVKPRDCIYQGLLILYGSALCISIIKIDLGRMPVLAAPFITATGTLLLTYEDDDMEWISRLLRHSLRLTLRDVLSSVSQKVSTDEMLQLTILRWIADYWAYTPEEPSTTTPFPEEKARPPPKSKTSPTPTLVQSSPSPQTPPNFMPSNSLGTRYPSRQRQASRFPRHEVQWHELLPMLQCAADHLTSEVQQLQSTDSNNCTQCQNQIDNVAVNNLKLMLMSLNVDERAKLAVKAYQRAVERFPPSKNIAGIVSVIRRCPALLTLILHLFSGSKSLFSTVALILPFVVLEYFRIHNWIQTIDRVSRFGREQPNKRFTETFSRVLSEADSMLLLLSGDTYSIFRPPTVLLVWHNIVSSVTALEIGLSAARCVQTTTVAVDFAGNVMSLLNLGFEVSNHGLLHGLAVMTKEVISMHVFSDELDTDHRRRATKYTSAAINAVNNAQFFAKNVETLAKDEKMDPILRPMVLALCTISGYGWLWGKEEETEEKKGATASDGKEEDTQTKREQNVGDEVVDVIKAITESPYLDVTLRNQPKNPHSIEELSLVMDMIAQAYGQGLIEQAEKDDFCSKLSTLSDAELFDPSVLMGMKRSVQIILDNGDILDVPYNESKGRNVTEIKDDNPSNKMPGARIYDSKVVDRVNASDSSVEERKKNINDIESDDDVIGQEEIAFEVYKADRKAESNIDKEASPTLDQSNSILETEGEISVSLQENRKMEDKSLVNGNDTWLKFGMATVGVIVGGALLSAQGGSDDAEKKKQPQKQSEMGNATKSSVRIVAQSIDDDDDWVSVGASDEKQ